MAKQEGLTLIRTGAERADFGNFAASTGISLDSIQSTAVKKTGERQVLHAADVERSNMSVRVQALEKDLLDQLRSRRVAELRLTPREVRDEKAKNDDPEAALAFLAGLPPRSIVGIGFLIPGAKPQSAFAVVTADSRYGRTEQTPTGVSRKSDALKIAYLGGVGPHGLWIPEVKVKGESVPINPQTTTLTGGVSLYLSGINDINETPGHAEGAHVKTGGDIVHLFTAIGDSAPATKMNRAIGQIAQGDQYMSAHAGDVMQGKRAMGRNITPANKDEVGRELLERPLTELPLVSYNVDGGYVAYVTRPENPPKVNFFVYFTQDLLDNAAYQRGRISPKLADDPNAKQEFAEVGIYRVIQQGDLKGLMSSVATTR